MSTLGFGVMALVVALLVKSMGGIVNVVISVAALTGVPLYLPLIWSLFSKRQNARTVLGVTFASLAINLLFKFVAPLFGLTLSRACEMSVGAFVPVVMLIIVEFLLWHNDYTDPKYADYAVAKQAVWTNDKSTGMVEDKLTAESNRFTRKVLATGIILSGAVIFVLGCMADEHGAIPMGMGLVISIVGIVMRISATLNKLQK